MSKDLSEASQKQTLFCDSVLSLFGFEWLLQHVAKYELSLSAMTYATN